jgi:hypothetical protein
MGNEDSVITNSTPEPVQGLEITHLGALTIMRSNQIYCLLKIFSYNDNFSM